MRRQRWWRWVWVIALGLMACETTSTQIKKDDNQIIGRPPERAEDPFADDALPPEASQTTTAGVMDVPSSKPPQKKAAQDNPPKTQNNPPKTQNTPPKTQPRPPEVAVKTQPDRSPKTSVSPKTTPDPPAGHQCYSCVRICPKEDTSSDCSESKEDMICGWGTAPTKEDASRLAQGQCTAALNMVRDASQWSSISGGCPVASCR